MPPPRQLLHFHKMPVWKIRKEEWAQSVRGNMRWKQQTFDCKTIALHCTHMQSSYVLVLVFALFCVVVEIFCQYNFQLIIYLFFWPGQTHPLSDPLFHFFHFSTSRFQLPRLSSPLPCASFPSTCPATAEINLRPASTAFTNMCPGRLQAIFKHLIFLYFPHNDALFLLVSWILSQFVLNSWTLVHLPSYFSHYSKRYCLKLYYSWHDHQNQHFNVWRWSYVLVCIYLHTVVSLVIRGDSSRSLHSARLTSNFECISGLPLLFLRPACLPLLGSQYLMGFFLRCRCLLLPVGSLRSELWILSSSRRLKPKGRREAACGGGERWWGRGLQSQLCTHFSF